MLALTVLLVSSCISVVSMPLVNQCLRIKGKKQRGKQTRAKKS